MPDHVVSALGKFFRFRTTFSGALSLFYLEAMCIGIWTLEHPEYALILCTNRDEFLDRPTRNAHFHSFGKLDDIDTSGQVLSGRDEQAGGSWFGINRAGRVALLTNITEAVEPFNSSRGSLVSSFLLSDSPYPLEDEVGKIVPKDAKYAGFNLLLLSPKTQPSGTIQYDSLFVTNHGGGGTLASRSLAPNEKTCGGISNGIDGAGASEWPKVCHATEQFKSLLKQQETPDMNESELINGLFDLLTWHPPEAIAKRADLRTTVQVPPLKIVYEGTGKTVPTYYGTRLSTVLLVKRNGEALFIERDIFRLVDGAPVMPTPPSQREFRFQLDVKSTAAEECN